MTKLIDFFTIIEQANIVEQNIVQKSMTLRKTTLTPPLDWFVYEAYMLRRVTQTFSLFQRMHNSLTINDLSLKAFGYNSIYHKVSIEDRIQLKHKTSKRNLIRLQISFCYINKRTKKRLCNVASRKLFCYQSTTPFSNYLKNFKRMPYFE